MKFFLVKILILLSVVFCASATTENTKGKKMDIDKNIQKQWDRLFKYYENNFTKKCQGATEEKIVEIERTFSVQLPKAFSDSFRVCDERYLFNDNEYGWFGKHEHYPLENTYL